VEIQRLGSKKLIYGSTPSFIFQSSEVGEDLFSLPAIKDEHERSPVFDNVLLSVKNDKLKELSGAKSHCLQEVI
jgi:hypothetical protein